MTIDNNEIHIYRFSIDSSVSELNYFEKLLSEDELIRANRFKFEKLRNHFITGRGYLRIILAKYLNQAPSAIDFSYFDKGKPYLSGSSIKFNLAHSDGKAVYAVTSEKEVGIDLEVIKEMPDALEIAKRFFSESEVQDFSEVGEDEIGAAFFNCWTRKEAFIKAIGEGLSYPLADFSVTLKPGIEPKFLQIKKNPEEINDWELFNVKSDDNFVSSLAIKAKNMEIVYKEIY